MKIKIVVDRISGFYWCIQHNNVVADGYADTHQEAKKNALVTLKKIAKSIENEIRIIGIKTYHKKPFKAFQWHSSMKNIGDVQFHSGRWTYNEVILKNNDWILPETGEVVDNESFMCLFGEVE